MAAQPRHAKSNLPIAERRAMIAPSAGPSVSRQCSLLRIARSSYYYQPRPMSADEVDLLNQLDRPGFHRASGVWQPAAASDAIARGDFPRTPVHPTADAQAGAFAGQGRSGTPADRIPGIWLRSSTGRAAGAGLPCRGLAVTSPLNYVSAIITIQFRSCANLLDERPSRRHHTPILTLCAFCTMDHSPVKP